MLKHTGRRRSLSARRNQLFVTLAFLLVTAAAGVAAASSVPGDDPVVGIYKPEGVDIADLVAFYTGDGFGVAALDDRTLERLPGAGVSMLVIPPGARFPIEARHALSDFLRNRGNMIVLEPTAFDYAPGCTDPKVVTTLEEGGRDYRLIAVAPDETTVAWEEIPGSDGDLGLRFVKSGRVISWPAAQEANAIWEIPPPVSERGREDTTLQEVFRNRHDVRRIPLLEIVDERGHTVGNSAEIRIVNGGYYQGSAIAMFGVEKAEYGADTELGRALLDASRYLLKTPRIQRVTANAYRNFANPLELSVDVLVSNPFDVSLEGELSVTVADGMMRGARTFTLSPRASDTVRVVVGAVPEEFPLLDFTWSAELDTPYGGDVITDRVRAEEILIDAAKHMMVVQESHEDGRFSHYFFQDIYGARAMLALGLHLQDPEVYQRNREALGELTGEDFIRSALRFTDMLVERQREDGAFPMGYHEHRDMRFIADLGSLALGLVQMASWLDEPRKSAYLEAVKKYFDLRETFYISEERAETLRDVRQQLGGHHSRLVRPGLHGNGLLLRRLLARDAARTEGAVVGLAGFDGLHRRNDAA